MVKQTHTYKGFSVITDYPKDASLWEAYAFRLWCAQDPHWECIPHGTKGIRQPGLLLLLHSPKHRVIAQPTLKYLWAFTEKHPTSQLSTDGQLPVRFRLVCLQLCHLSRFHCNVKQTHERNSVRCSGFQNCLGVHTCWACRKQQFKNTTTNNNNNSKRS